MFTLASSFTVRHYSAFSPSIRDQLQINHLHIWLMPVLNMTVKEPLFSVMILHMQSLSVAIKHAHLPCFTDEMDLIASFLALPIQIYLTAIEYM
jgi:hypothetical protein